MNLHPDILAALRKIVGDPDADRVAKVHTKHKKQFELRLETHLEMLSEEVEQVIPRTHTLFESVLLLTLLNRVERYQQTKQASELQSFLEGDFPQGW